MHKMRTYRRWIRDDDLVSFEVKEKETDLHISAAKNLEAQARQAILNCRIPLEEYIARNADFHTSLKPVSVGEDAPAIARVMAHAAAKAGVGPMAAVAGAIAECVGRELLAVSDEVIVENGGDIFMKTAKTRKIAVYAGEDSPFTGKLFLEMAPSENGIGVCTSSGTVSHSLSFGKADAAVIISKDTALADAVATAAANIIKSDQDIERAIDFAKAIEGVSGVLVMIKDRMGSWGEIKLI